MRTGSHGEHETRLIGAPLGWDQDRDGPCGALSVIDYRDPAMGGRNRMISRWELEDDDLEKLQKGAPIYLSILGQDHPVVCLYVGDPAPEAVPADDAHDGDQPIKEA